MSSILFLSLPLLFLPYILPGLFNFFPIPQIKCSAYFLSISCFLINVSKAINSLFGTTLIVLHNFFHVAFPMFLIPSTFNAPYSFCFNPSMTLVEYILVFRHKESFLISFGYWFLILLEHYW